MNPITVGIVEDNRLLAQDIAEKLSLSEEIQVVLQAPNGKVLLDTLCMQPAPHVLLMDIEMDLMDGITATREVKRLYPHIQIVILTVFDDENKLFEAIKAGASGYLLKDEKPGRLIQALFEVQMGGSPMSPSIATKVLSFLRTQSLPAATTTETHTNTILTTRESEVLNYLKQGLPMRQMAERMFVSERTVHKHLEHIYQKLHVSGSREAVAKMMGGR